MPRRVSLSTETRGSNGLAQATIVVIAVLLAVGGAFWVLWAVGIPFEPGIPCIGTTADVAQQAVAVVGLGLAIAALIASVANRRRAWVYFTAGVGATYASWEILTQLAANANC